ncbi:hypothetical protein ABL975_08855 [Pseudomonas aeruginosa]|uniref:hypothetical protein n=1 Tax=Pseudomonas aeruginosa TaxID=287 RepID=UPI00053F14E9|nr:hypothetical protein [Pseudomonas aeruginosa]MCF8576966.1 hypothetical protein [Pseudomonas aeruginosa]MCG7142613.1 hypothetical protein [Pseudomonas aeruginosa]MCG7149060.1 hypothetical protein [Pseudomonas aeruginosa]MCO2875838.1 hypothetical protein [Pseudomonas aeruginosa]MDF5924927.1 hypothetical protein [Pseudomonas aeruginosa]
MQNFFRMTFGGLSAKYYFRQLFFGSLFLALIVFLSISSQKGMKVDLLVLSLVCTWLYPYSRFVYESVIGFLLGENIFYVPAIFLLFAKLMTMAICWSFAIFIAPIGLLYLYFHHRRAGGPQDEP